MHQQAVIGLIGGMSWESSAEYYRIINREVRNRLGGVHSARSLMWSVDFGEIEHLQHQGDWDELTRQTGWIAAGRILSCSAPTPCTGWRTRSPRRSGFRCSISPIP